MSVNKMVDKRNILIDLKIERARIIREKASVLLDKALFLYFTAIFVAVLGFVNNYVTRGLLNLIVIFGLVVVLVSFIPYMRDSLAEKTLIDKLISKAK